MFTDLGAIRKTFRDLAQQWVVKLRPFIPIAVLLFVAATSFLANKMGVKYLLVLAALPPAVVFLYIVFRYPVIGLILTLLGGIFVPFSGPSGINAAVLGVALMIGIWIVKMIVVDRSIDIVPSKTFIPLLLFFISSIVSFIVGQLSLFSFASRAPLDAQIGGFLIFMFCGLAFLVVPHLIKDLIYIKIFTWLFLVVGGIYMLGRALGLDIFDRLYQNGFVANSMFWTWLVALAFGQVLLNHTLDIKWRIMLVGILVVTGYVAYTLNRDWKSGYIPPLVAVAVILLLRYPKIMIGLLPFAAIGFYWVTGQAIATDKYSWGTRLDAWTVVLGIAKVSPLLGMGFGNYSYYTKLFSLRGYYLRFNSHSQYVDIIAQTGLIGLLVFLWIIFEVGRLGWNLRKKVTDGFSTGYVNGVLGGIAGTLAAAFLVDWILPYVYNIGFNGFRASILPWVFFGGLVSIEQLLKSKS